MAEFVFDLYGTLVDIHTEENAAAWEKTALFLGYHGVQYSAQQLQQDYEAAARRYQTERTMDIPMERVLAELFRGAEAAGTLAVSAARQFRIASTEYIRLYPHVAEALQVLRKAGHRLWLLSNAQAVFTRCELKLLGLEDAFDGMFLSSEFGFRKPDPRFFHALLQDRDPAHFWMIGNDRDTDIAGAKAAGMKTIFLHTNQTPAHQTAADPALYPGKTGGKHYEFEGSNWEILLPLLLQL